jgi:tyrosyl-tRNA synthetase
MDPHAAIALIKANLAEVLNPEIIDDVILKQGRPLKGEPASRPMRRAAAK